jgi:phage-related protein
MPDIPRFHRKRRWRKYKTEAGRCPVDDFLETVSDEDAAEIAAGMFIVRRDGLAAARHLRGAIYEVRVDGFDQTYRLLFAPQGKYSTILLALEAFSKKTQQTPPVKIELAEQRLKDWNRRGVKRRLFGK